MSETLTIPDDDSMKQRDIVRYQRGVLRKHVDDLLVQEVPVALEYNGIAYTVMMCTPMNLEEFAVGFSLTEGIIDHSRDIHHIEVLTSNNGMTLSIEVANRCINRLKEKRRSLMGVTGCGICGAEQLSSVCRCISPLPTNSTFDLSQLDDILSQLTGVQPLNQYTGASHAAAYVGRSGKIEAVFEDVGRHIALDKLVGWIAQTHQSQGAILVTSRASFEMVQKVAVSGIEILLAISAATNMAVDVAERLNITLCGYCRQGRANIYTHAERMI